MGLFSTENTPHETAREQRRQTRTAADGAIDLPQYLAKVAYGWPSPQVWDGTTTPTFPTFQEAVIAGHKLAATQAAKGRPVKNFHIFQPLYSPADQRHNWDAIAAYEYNPRYEVDEARDLGLV